MTKSPVPIKLTKAGIFTTTADGEKRIAAPIRFHAIGERLDHTKVVEIRFVNCDGTTLSEQFDMAAINPRNLATIADALGNKGYLWPTDGVSAVEILKVVVAEIPSRRFIFVGAPGWYEDAIVTPLRRYGGTKRILIDPNTGAHLASYTKGSGSLKGWQKTVGKLAKSSTRLRLSIAASLAVPFLRPLRMDSFAINLFGQTSMGKTSLLHGAASVPGLHHETTGLPKWADSETAIEQLAIGHRDGLLPLDESGDQSGSMPVHEKAKKLAFLFSRNRAKTLDKNYQKKINLTVRDFRVIVLSTSESALNTIAEAAGQRRIGGEEVRFIDVPASEPGSIGVFDHVKIPSDRDPSEYGRMLADNLRRDAELNQGFAMDAFLKEFMQDPEAALARIKHHIREFTAKISMTLGTGPDQRVCANFSVMYAAAALGIEYGILPWKKKSTRAAITKCMVAALTTIREASASPAKMALSISDVARGLKDKLEPLSLITVNKGKPCAEDESRRRQAADGLRVGTELYIKSKRLGRFSPAEGKELVAHKILRTEKRVDNALTVSRKIAGIEQKLRYYIIDTVALDQFLRVNSATS